jgi:hypothetical protein
MRSRWSLVSRLVLALALGLVFPHVELAWKCRAAAIDSEACVWSRAYLPLSIWVEPLIITPIAFLLITLAVRLVAARRRQSPSP